MTIEQQVMRTLTRPLHKLPASWWLPEVAEAMSDWIRRYGRR